MSKMLKNRRGYFSRLFYIICHVTKKRARDKSPARCLQLEFPDVKHQMKIILVTNENN